jgi:ParB family chromosome partitioning protein
MAKQKPIIILAQGENIPLNQLRLSPDNVRKTYTQADIEEMAADIRTNGLIQSLSVRKLAEPDGDIRAEVQAGGRRFHALNLLAKKKEIADDAPIPTVPNERQIAEQISLAENVQRKQMHPLDEFRAFAAMLSKGMTEDAIADAQHVQLRTVKQRLRMANASPVILKAFADGKITLHTLMTFCVTDNHERQETVWKEVKGGHVGDWAIKDRLLEDAVPTSDKRVKFVGLAAYEKNGGVVERDLFDDNNQGYIKDVELLNQMVHAKLERAAEKHKADGWGFAIVAPTIADAETRGFDQLTPANDKLTAKEQKHLDELQAEHEELQEIPTAELTKKQEKRLDALTAEIEAIENREPVYSAEDMARGGITVEIDYNGKLVVERGFVKPEDDDGKGTDAAANASAADEDDGNTKLPDSLVADLTWFRTLALQSALAENPEVAFVATLHAMATTVLSMSSTNSCLQVRATVDKPPQIDGIKDFAPTKAMAAQRKAWQARLPRDSVKLWETIEAMPREEQMQLLAFLAASTINVVVLKHDQRSSQVNHSHVLAEALAYDIRKDWKPTADNFFNRVRKATIMAAVSEAKDPHTADLMTHMKKEGMAREAERVVQEAGTGWLPAPMRSEQADVEDEASFEEAEADDSDLPPFLQDGASSEEVAARA